MIYNHIDELIGKTPLLLPERYNRKFCRYGTVLCKMECFNPAGSAKDRVALYMLNNAAEQGLIKPGSTVITSTKSSLSRYGNTALAGVFGLITKPTL